MKKETITRFYAQLKEKEVPVIVSDDVMDADLFIKLPNYTIELQAELQSEYYFHDGEDHGGDSFWEVTVNVVKVTEIEVRNNEGYEITGYDLKIINSTLKNNLSATVPPPNPGQMRYTKKPHWI